jgi:hypothetical protein
MLCWVKGERRSMDDISGEKYDKGEEKKVSCEKREEKERS